MTGIEVAIATYRFHNYCEIRGGGLVMASNQSTSTQDAEYWYWPKMMVRWIGWCSRARSWFVCRGWIEMSERARESKLRVLKRR